MPDSKEIFFKEISCAKARLLMDEHVGNPGFVVLDFRSYESYEKEHLYDALCYLEHERDIDTWLGQFDRDRTYLLYCAADQASFEGLLRMKRLKFKHVYRMKEGLKRWKELGYETVKIL